MDPTPSPERIQSIDIVRGFALTGVFLINSQSMISWANLEGTANGAAAWFLESLIAGKFYRLFAFLFGVGFVLQMRRFEARDAPFAGTYLRRLAVLFVIGVAHGMLLWPNDILALFAQLGVLLLLIRHVPNRWLVVVGLACLFAAPMNYYVSTGFADFFPAADQVQSNALRHESPVGDEEVERIRSSGSYPEVATLASRLFLDWQTDRHGRLLILREEFLMFLFGLYAGRRRLFERAAQQTAFIRRAIVGTLVAGFLASPTIGWLNDLAAHPTNGHLAITFRQAISAIQAAAFSLAYGLIALYLIERFRLHRRLAPIASIGRMALTNYLMLSVLVSTTFYSYGLGLYGRVTVLEGITLAGTAFMALAAASSWWLRRFRFGPAEWVWRSLTYGTMQPMKGAARSLPS